MILFKTKTLLHKFLYFVHFHNYRAILYFIYKIHGFIINTREGIIQSYLRR